MLSANHGTSTAWRNSRGSIKAREQTLEKHSTIIIGRISRVGRWWRRDLSSSPNMTPNTQVKRGRAHPPGQRSRGKIRRNCANAFIFPYSANENNYLPCVLLYMHHHNTTAHPQVDALPKDTPTPATQSRSPRDVFLSPRNAEPPTQRFWRPGGYRHSSSRANLDLQGVSTTTKLHMTRRNRCDFLWNGATNDGREEVE